MAMTYTEAKVTLADIARRSARNYDLVEQAIAMLNKASDDLGAMPADYQGAASEISGAAAANPDDVAWQSADSEKDHMIQDFQDLKVRVDGILATIAALEA